MSRQSAREVTLPEIHRCPECGGGQVFPDDARGELFCGDCGLVLGDHAIDEGAEWAAYSCEENDRLARTGPPKRALFGASDLTTTIPLSDRDGMGRPIPRDKKDLLRRLRNLQYHSTYHRGGERNLRYIGRLLAQTCSRLDLPESVEEEAGLICSKALKRGLSRGRPTADTVAAAVYAACRLLGVPRTLDELAEATRIRREAIGRTYRALRRNSSVNPMPTPGPSDYVARFCSNLDLGNAVRAEALRLIRVWEGLSGRTGVAPAGVAAAAIYGACAACGDDRTEETIAKAAGVTSATLRHRLRDLERATDATGGSGTYEPHPHS